MVEYFQKQFTDLEQPPEVLYKKMVFLKISKNSQEKTCANVYFFNKIDQSQVRGLQLH